MKDQEIFCVQCDNTVIITADEKKRLLEKGFDSPIRCPDCRKRKHRNFEEEDEAWKKNKKKWHSRRERSYFREDNDT